ncbi:hemerythrin domain-containing protein [Oceanobacillus sp. Castelsardo]|uniref:hemerythrin domain-containing protein n=1 Tax=Oceanobacillus sp. Castelsardo TaxID=1851204 RepID=UPI000838EA27|nr:hemerythrin domain-containing protein [Oceanobacillus sp. Castelsardo]
MSGKGLKHVDSHSAIHDAALEEARELNGILGKLVNDNQMDKALEIAYIAVEHWETRTLRHADAEEEGLYKELVEESPELKDEVIALTRDHDILRYIVKEIKQSLETDGFNRGVLEMLHTLVHVDAFHNQEEERILPHH